MTVGGVESQGLKLEAPAWACRGFPCLDREPLNKLPHPGRFNLYGTTRIWSVKFLARRGERRRSDRCNRRKMEDQRRPVAEKEAAKRRATDAQMLEDAECLITAWNERQAKRMPILFSPTIGAAFAARYWFKKARARTSPQSDHTFKLWGCASGGEQLKC